MTEASSVQNTAKPLSEKPLGYVLAVLGGMLGGPLGMLASPAVLFGLSKVMQPKDGKSPNRFSKWALTGILGVPLCLGITSSLFPNSSGGTLDTSKDQSSVVQQQPSKPASVPLASLEQVKDDRALQVDSSETLETIAANNEFMEPVQSKGGKLVGVFLTIKNTGKESGNMFWTTFQLRDSQDRRYDDIEDFKEIMTIDMWAKDQGLAQAGDQLFPGATAKTAVVFRVAPDAEDLKLVVNNDIVFDIK
jgi:Domain of unknown function (DUF4352)